jgi:microsomal dipeptidase-like Zn-dependent dipeptidase
VGALSRFVEVFNDSRIMTDLNHTSYKVLLEILKHLVLIIECNKER